jgi:hypothetical protein
MKKLIAKTFKKSSQSVQGLQDTIALTFKREGEILTFIQEMEKVLNTQVSWVDDFIEEKKTITDVKTLSEFWEGEFGNMLVFFQEKIVIIVIITRKKIDFEKYIQIQ